MTQDYIGTKRVTAWPRLRSLNEDGTPKLDAPLQEEGYGVRYEDGYTSWSPKAAFEAAYQPVTAMSFEGALFAMKAEHRVARAGWNGKSMWVWLEPGGGMHLVGITEEFSASIGTSRPWFMLKAADGTFCPWTASQTDLLADDWMIVE